MNRQQRRANQKAFEKDKHIRVKRNRYKYQKALDEGKDPNEVLKRSQSELNIEKIDREKHVKDLMRKEAKDMGYNLDDLL